MKSAKKSGAALPASLYVITNRRLCAPDSLKAIITRLLKEGVRFFQIREKDLSPDELTQIVGPIVQLARDYSATVLINSCVQVAEDTAADGAHLPANAGSVMDIRAELDTPAIIGCSAHSYKEAHARQRQGADFITYSPIFPVSGKPGYGPPVGTDGLKTLVSRISIPVLALGGVTPERVENCLAAGAAGVAVMSTLMQTPEKAEEYLRHLGE